MDTSETYIKMGDCPEIQEFKPEFLEGEFVYHRGDGSSEADQAGEWLPDFDEYYIWLPRQDQLQAMADGTGGFYHTLRELQGFAQSVINDIEGKHGNRGLNSMEQLWLAFVMSELYGKIWNGENWIRE